MKLIAFNELENKARKNLALIQLELKNTPDKDEFQTRVNRNKKRVRILSSLLGSIDIVSYPDMLMALYNCDLITEDEFSESYAVYKLARAIRVKLNDLNQEYLKLYPDSDVPYTQKIWDKLDNCLDSQKMVSLIPEIVRLEMNLQKIILQRKF